jgi:hypothetical protein
MIDKLDDATLDGIVRICNDDNFRAEVHPNVCKKLRFEKWMAELCIPAEELLRQEWKKKK